MHGFLGTGATFRADLNLMVQIVMGLALLLGLSLARRKRFRAHMLCQSAVMLLNLVMIVLIMLPSFRKQVEPHILTRLHDLYYSVAALHAGLGILAELLGLYIVLVAATNFLPASLRFQRYKPWMRTALALWWVVLLIGVGTYYIWYLHPAPKAAVPASVTVTPNVASTERVTVKITNFAFQPKELTIPAGTTVEWITEMGRHLVYADDASFKSEVLEAGGRFEHTFDQPGTYAYYCDFHGDTGGKDMAGTITVLPGAAK